MNNQKLVQLVPFSPLLLFVNSLLNVRKILHCSGLQSASTERLLEMRFPSLRIQLRIESAQSGDRAIQLLEKPRHVLSAGFALLARPDHVTIAIQGL